MAVRYRPVDADGDMMPVLKDSQMLTGVRAVMGAVNSRLRLLRGEWWEDETLGFRVPAFLFDGNRLPSGPDMLSSYITSYIAETEDVNAVINVDTSLKNRVLRYACEIQTPYGSDKWRMNQDVLLRALP